MIYDSIDDEIELDPFNGYEYVDLGLPSGTLWAKCNVGAETETDFGLYFAWGETVGYSAATSTKQFSWSDYKWGTDTAISKYNSTDGKTVLELEDDAARVNMCGSWCMPSAEQLQELVNAAYVTVEWVTNYKNSGHHGTLFTSVSNGNTIFIPAAGRWYEGSNEYVNTFDYVWSKTLRANTVSNYYCYAVSINCSSTGWNYYYGTRSGGRTVRGVINP